MESARRDPPDVLQSEMDASAGGSTREDGFPERVDLSGAAAHLIQPLEGVEWDEDPNPNAALDTAAEDPFDSLGFFPEESFDPGF